MAPGQHARFIERRGAMLRQSLHCLESQLMREGISAEFDVLLAEAVFAGNALIHIGGVTPYQCVFGRSPAMLPPLPEETEGQDGPSAGSDRVRQHVRTAAIEAMVQAHQFGPARQELFVRNPSQQQRQNTKPETL